MTQPAKFTVHAYTEPPSAERWPIESTEVERLWLPLLGPTAWALLRLLERDLDDAAHGGWGVHVECTVVEVAERLGVAPSRLWQNVLRLDRFRMITRDLIDDSYDHPVWCVSGSVRAMDDREWRRLPESVRKREGARRGER